MPTLLIYQRLMEVVVGCRRALAIVIYSSPNVAEFIKVRLAMVAETVKRSAGPVEVG